jgi:transcriptional regulator with XRE-family HTH domain
MNISKLLKTRRLELGISQAALAKHLGLAHKSSVHYLESGKQEWKFEQVLKACELLELDIIIGEQNEKDEKG